MRLRELIQINEAEPPEDAPSDALVLKRRCIALLQKIESVLDPQDQPAAVKVGIIVDPLKRGSPASALIKRNAILVSPLFQDAPDEVIIWMIGHELTHILRQHTNVGDDNKIKPPAQIRQQELDADDLANTIMKRLNINKAAVWTWTERERGGIERRLRWDATPAGQEWNQNSTHPSINDRIRNAQQHGVELSQAEMQDKLAQLDQLKQTLA